MNCDCLAWLTLVEGEPFHLLITCNVFIEKFYISAHWAFFRPVLGRTSIEKLMFAQRDQTMTRWEAHTNNRDLLRGTVVFLVESPQIVGEPTPKLSVDDEILFLGIDWNATAIVAACKEDVVHLLIDEKVIALRPSRGDEQSHFNSLLNGADWTVEGELRT